MIDLKLLLQREMDFLDQQILEKTKERDSAATPMESHSDKTRDLADQVVQSLKDQKKKLNQIAHQLSISSKFQGVVTIDTLVTLKSPVGEKKFLLVPEGLGGKMVNDIFLLGINTPLASTLIGHKIGYNFSFNNQNFQILFLEPNN